MAAESRNVSGIALHDKDRDAMSRVRLLAQSRWNRAAQRPFSSVKNCCETACSERNDKQNA
jgi:hypothetical protein